MSKRVAVWRDALDRHVSQARSDMEDHRTLVRKTLRAVNDAKSALYSADANRVEPAVDSVHTMLGAVVHQLCHKAVQVRERAEAQSRLRDEVAACLSAQVELEAAQRAHRALRRQAESAEAELASLRAVRGPSRAAPPSPGSTGLEAVHGALQAFTAVLLPWLSSLEAIAPDMRTPAESRALEYLSNCKEHSRLEA